MAKEKALTLAIVTGPRGGRTKVQIKSPFEYLTIGARKVSMSELADVLPSKGDRRRVRRALYQHGFRNLAFRSVFN